MQYSKIKINLFKEKYTIFPCLTNFCAQHSGYQLLQRMTSTAVYCHMSLVSNQKSAHLIHGVFLSQPTDCARTLLRKKIHRKIGGENVHCKKCC